ncbi:LysE family transporter [Vibrio europaeus]|uniref:Transporter n=1 Tax=Vibrio europaeus TaxID=300876 RepID=A0A178J7L6_9VIBR|nr:LysE family transporter [Vibrio europaeus]MDC5705627.1 LysE family transporter [Vibrio europaeus]MDC5710906.1 LysE family transporter [Vibrio europaeus]MDC5715996.1 LysE family transporter [Vibrio europaeus]MDC5720157.1 LysE family transporter [Vibrio europaeus]MDC5723955.1 LysE family transporter [Vibrio europaeus]
MSEIFAYAIGVMYTPGPVNLLGLHSGLNRNTRSHLGFFIGVGMAMFILFVMLGFIGLKVINPQVLPFISLAGCLYILHIAWKVAGANVEFSQDTSDSNSLSFRDGLFMQLLNPKALVATLPVSTIQFPSVGITGSAIVLWSLVLAILAFGAPTGYSLAGLVLGKRISNPSYFKVFNLLMAALLVYVSLTIGYEHVVTPLLAL